MNRIETIKTRLDRIKPYVKNQAIVKLSGVNLYTLQNAFSGSPISEEKLDKVEKAIEKLEKVFL